MNVLKPNQPTRHRLHTARRCHRRRQGRVLPWLYRSPVCATHRWLICGGIGTSDCGCAGKEPVRRVAGAAFAALRKSLATPLPCVDSVGALHNEKCHRANTVAFVLKEIGGFCEIRTRDLRIKSPLLYQLS